MQTEPTAYERDLEARRAIAARRHALAVTVADHLAARLTHGGSVDWRLVRTPLEIDGERIEVTNGRERIIVHPGGYQREQRLVAYVPTHRYVQFGPEDWDTVQVTVTAPTEATVAETKEPWQIAKEFGRRLGLVALAVADALDAKQAEMTEQRGKGAAVLQQFRAAGWHVNAGLPGTNNAAHVYVPDDHPLRAVLGIYGFRVDQKTGEMQYQSTPYLRSTATPADILAIK
jgi:hypothetical protein